MASGILKLNIFKIKHIILPPKLAFPCSFPSYYEVLPTNQILQAKSLVFLHAHITLAINSTANSTLPSKYITIPATPQLTKISNLDDCEAWSPGILTVCFLTSFEQLLKQHLKAASTDHTK